MHRISQPNQQEKNPILIWHYTSTVLKCTVCDRGVTIEMNQGNNHKSITTDYKSIIKQGQVIGVYLKKNHIF